MKPTDELGKSLSDEQMTFASEMRGFTIDTTIFERKQFAFESEPLSSLAGRPHDGRKFLMPKVIYDEVLRHLVEKATTEKASLEKSLRSAANYLGIPKQLLDPVKAAIPQSPEDYSVDRLNDFLTENQVEILPMAMGDTDLLFDLYSKQKAPFRGDKPDKKKEFPDAGALLCLKAWAETNGKVLVVSGDSGWKDFCAQYPQLFHVTDDVTLILQMLLPGAAQNIFELILEEVTKNKEQALIKIKTEITDYISDAPFEIEAYPSGAYYVEAETTSASVDSIELIEAVPISYDETTQIIKIKFLFTVQGSVEGQFSFSIYDKEDKQYYLIGDSNGSQENEWECEVITEFYFDDATWNLDEISINLDTQVIEFSDVEPDFGPD